MKLLKNFLRGEQAATAVEYAVMLALILMVCFMSIVLLGQRTGALWGSVNTSLGSAGVGS